MFSFVFSEYDFLPFSQAQVFPPSHSGRQSALPAISAPAAGSPSFGYCVPFDRLLFLHRQENEAAALAPRAIGGVRELVQPSGGLWPVRSPARGAHARGSQIGTLAEGRA